MSESRSWNQKCCDGATIEDHRTEEDKALTWAFVVATDSFLSGWGKAPRRSLFAVPVKDHKQADTVIDNMNNRSDMKRPRLVSNLPRLKPGDHLSIRSMDDSSRFYQVGGFSQ